MKQWTQTENQSQHTISIFARINYLPYIGWYIWLQKYTVNMFK